MSRVDTVVNAVTSTVKSFFEALPALIFGAGIAAVIMSIMLITALSAKENACDSKGDMLGYASQYTTTMGCQFKVDGEWKSIDTMKFELKK